MPASKILAVTFTRKAAGEMKERLAGMTGRRLPEVRTLHSWAGRLCRAWADSPIVRRTRDFTIYDGTDQDDVLRAAARDLGIATWERAKPATLRKNPEIVDLYEDRKRMANALDYDDLEGLALRLLQEYEPAQREWTQRYRHVLVDEYQDTNLA